jgi:putative SOS response-associated peptidase YedK
MCGRFVLTLPHDAMAQLFEAVPANDLPPVPNFNVCPTDPIPAVMRDETGRRLVTMRWGLLPVWYKTPGGGPLLINARSDTIAEKPAFREAVRERRCVIAAAGFYEWTSPPDDPKTRLPWFIHRADGAPMIMAGIWQPWERGGERKLTCAIVTTEAAGPMGTLHDRMPVILSPGDVGLWLGEEGHGAARLMTAAPDETLAFHRVDPAVNSNRAKGPQLIEPVAG